MRPSAALWLFGCSCVVWMSCTAPRVAPVPSLAARANPAPTFAPDPEQESPLPPDPLLETLGGIADGVGSDRSPWWSDAFEPKPGGKACTKLRAQLAGTPSSAKHAGDAGASPQPPFEEICYEDAAGFAWGTRVSFALGELGHYSGTFELFRLGVAEPRASAGVERYEGLGFSDVVYNSPPVWIWFFDFDHDARPEALVLHWESADNARRDPKVVIWSSSAAGTLTHYAPSKELRAFATLDVDHDAAPDLAYNPYAKSTSEPTVYIGSYPRHSLVDWSLLAHAQADGSFSLADEVARDYARRLCPTPVIQLPKERDAWPWAIHCAKLWRSADRATIGSWLERGCANPDPNWLTPCESSKEFYRALVDVDLPVHLAR